MTENRFKYRDVGSNCLDGNPDEKWRFGNKCKNGEKSYEVPINLLEGNILLVIRRYFHKYFVCIKKRADNPKTL